MVEGGCRWNSRAFPKNSKDVDGITTSILKVMPTVAGGFAVYSVHII